MNRLIWIAVIGLLLAPATVRAQDVVVYYHTDAIGSVRAMTDETGTLIHHYDFLPFGEAWMEPTNPDNRQFAGKERDRETGLDLDYFGARYHLPVIGRFTTVDPVMNIEAALTDPQRWNRYSYVGNRPLKLVDPDGRDWMTLLFKVGRAAFKGEDVYSSVSGVVENTSTIFSMDGRVGTGDRLAATGGLVWELSGAGDLASGARSIGSFAARHADSAVGYTRSIRKNLGRLSGAVEEGAHAHHVLPRKFGERFKQAGLDTNDARYGAWWAAQDHLRNSKGYNDQWETFFGRNPNATSADILQFGRQLASQYGLKIFF